MFYIKILALVTCFGLSSKLHAVDSSSSSDSTSTSSSEGESSSAKDMGGVSEERVRKPKRNFQVKGSFKGRDPMIAPDGQSTLAPTDGSRPKSQ